MNFIRIKIALRRMHVAVSIGVQRAMMIVDQNCWSNDGAAATLLSMMS